MRDIALSIVVSALLILALRHPVVGAYLWAWLSLMNPHKMTYGFAYSMPFAQAAALVTLFGFAFAGQRRRMVSGPLVTLLLALFLWMTLTSFFAIAPVERVQERWIQVAKIQLMLLVSLCLILDARQLRTLIWVVALSVGFFGIKGGIWTVLTGGGGRVWGPPGSMLQGNNELAVALVMLLPMFYFLQHTETRRWLRKIIGLAMLPIAFAILGSQSRGALLALLAMAFFLGIKGRYPVRTTLLLAVGVALAIAFMPETWSQRMETISNYEEDSSAMSRIWTWTTLWNVAVDRPFVGAGFAADNLEVFGRYAPREGVFAMFDGQVFVAHSIYFQMLGEHGFVGLVLFLLLGVTTWVSAGRLARKAALVPAYAAWMPMLMRMSQVSLIGYASGGAFLSLAYMDLPYYIVGFVVICRMLLRQPAGATSEDGVAAAVASAPAGPTRRSISGAARAMVESGRQ
jgi:probable O-glycosylation ligase (exosortase A-associated)